MLDLAFTADEARAEPVYRQLAEHIQELVDNQRLTPGAKLPPTRVLAGSLGLNRNTINHAYQDLLSTPARKFDDVFSAPVMQPGGGLARPHRAWRAGGVDRDG